MPEVATPNQGEREFETGTDEFFKHRSETNAGQADPWFANVKRTYDEYQHESLESIRRNRSIVDKIVSDAQQHDNARQAIANQALQNAVETANMVGKQAVKHADIAADALWNPIQQGAGNNLTAGAVPANRAIDTSTAAVSVDSAAVAAAVAKSVDATVTPLVATLTELVKVLSAVSGKIATA